MSTSALDALQWPAMVATLLAAHVRAYALIVLQIGHLRAQLARRAEERAARRRRRWAIDGDGRTG